MALACSLLPATGVPVTAIVTPLGGASTQAGPATAAPGETQQPEGPPDSGAPTALPEELFGIGPFNLPDPAAGLADLAGYQAALTMAFDGTRDGAPLKWTKTYTLLAAREPPARLLTIARDGGLPDTSPVWLAEAGGTAYDRRPEQGCLASALGPEGGPAAALEPAAMLTGVLGAQEAGQETVNDVPANHYAFDERALGQLGLAKASGEVWVAAEGGYVVRYLSSTTGDADFFGAGTAGTLALDYELTGAGQPPAIVIPADCPAGLVDAPQLPDAANVDSQPGALASTTQTSLPDALAFYLSELPALGWTAVGDSHAATPAPDQTTAILDFTRPGLRLTVVLSAGDGGTSVRLVESREP